MSDLELQIQLSSNFCIGKKFVTKLNVLKLFQPYRTTPLVLPGAKIKKDAPLGECYLRHHPNPLIRAAPHHYDHLHPDVAMKQKVRKFKYNIAPVVKELIRTGTTIQTAFNGKITQWKIEMVE